MSTTTATATPSATAVPPCAGSTDIFQNPLLEDGGVAHGAPARREQQILQHKAQAICGECPLLASCLFDAVVKHDVSGFVAGTTQRQRQEIRQQLGVKVQPEDLDTLAGVTAPNRQVNHEEVVRLRNANPFESLETIAQRLGCSLSTVKRHLRRARDSESTPTLRSVAPSLEQVMHAYRTVMTRRATGTANRRAA